MRRHGPGRGPGGCAGCRSGCSRWWRWPPWHRWPRWSSTCSRPAAISSPSCRRQAVSRVSCGSPAAACFLGLLTALGAMLREREAQARSQALQFALERSQFEQQALDARLRCCRRRSSRTSCSTRWPTCRRWWRAIRRAPPTVLKSLIAYLRAAMPRLHDATPTLGNEAGAGARLPRADADAHARPAAVQRSMSTRRWPSGAFRR